MTQNQNPKRSNSNGKGEEDMTARTSTGRRAR